MIVVIVRLPLRSLPSGFQDLPYFITNFSLCRYELSFQSSYWQFYSENLSALLCLRDRLSPALIKLNQSRVLQASSPMSSHLRDLTSPCQALTLPQAFHLLLPHCQRQSGYLRIPTLHVNFREVLFLPQPTSFSGSLHFHCLGSIFHPSLHASFTEHKVSEAVRRSPCLKSPQGSKCTQITEVQPAHAESLQRQVNYHCVKGSSLVTPS